MKRRARESRGARPCLRLPYCLAAGKPGTVDPRAAIEPTLRAPLSQRASLSRRDAAADDPSTPLDGPRERSLEARVVGHFAVLRKVGEGGMGVVYAAYDERLARRVALKLIHGDDPVRLLREAQALARVSHPNVVQIYEVGTYAGQVFVAMEYVEGPTLAQWLTAPRDVAEILEVFVQAGCGLEAAHARGLVHRDFKPGNVIVGDDGRARVLDFGLARADEQGDEPVPEDMSGEHRATSSLLDAPLTRTGALVGTPAYMSPEQFLGAPVDARSDQFSFCVALYEALYGRRPFEHPTAATLTGGAVQGRVEPPPQRAELAPTIPAAIVRGLAAEPAQRWPTMRELLEVLAQGGGQVAARGAARAGRSMALLVAGAGLVLFVAVTVLWTPAEVTPASMTRFALLLALVAFAALPALRARYRDPGQRKLVDFGVLMVSLSVVVRLFSWRAGLSMSDMAATESLCFVAAYATMALFQRAPRVLWNLPLLLGALVLVFELGAWPQLLSLSWLLSVPLTALAWRRTAALQPGRRVDGAMSSMTTTASSRSNRATAGPASAPRSG